MHCYRFYKFEINWKDLNSKTKYEIQDAVGLFVIIFCPQVNLLLRECIQLCQSKTIHYIIISFWNTVMCLQI